MPHQELTEHNTCPVVHSQASKAEEVPFLANHHVQRLHWELFSSEVERGK